MICGHTSNVNKVTDEYNPHPWNRYVAIGDSFTEGIGDPDDRVPGGHRGWADRVAEQLSVEHQDFAYANLAIRGRVLRQILDEQIDQALSLKPDLITISAGGNDVIRPGSDPDVIAAELETGLAKLTNSGAAVVLFTGPDTGDSLSIGNVRAKTAIYNENLHMVAKQHDAIIADMWAVRELRQQQMWADDRLHFSPLGHHTIALMVLDTLNVPHQLEALEVAPLPAKSWREAAAEDLVWARQHLAPWVLRRLRHQSSGDGITPKRPEPAPVYPITEDS